MAARRFLLSALCLGLPLAGCAAGGPFPSLAPRPGELGGSEAAAPPVEAPPAAPAADAGLAGRIAALVTQAQAGQTAFEAALAETKARVVAAGSAGSEAWIAGQQALSQLESVRTPTAVALSDLDKLARERTESAPGADADLAAIAAASDEVRAIVDRQDAEINRLSDSLAAP